MSCNANCSLCSPCTDNPEVLHHLGAGVVSMVGKFLFHICFAVKHAKLCVCDASPALQHLSRLSIAVICAAIHLPVCLTASPHATTVCGAAKFQGGWFQWVGNCCFTFFFAVKDAQLCVCHPSLPLLHLSLLTPQHCCHLCRHLPVFLIAHLQEDLQYSNAGGIPFSIVGDICNLQMYVCG